MIKAMILCAGFGKRLQPLTFQRPKPLLEIDNHTLLSNTINFLEKFGIRQVVINIHYLGEQIVDYIKKKNLSLDISIVKEEEREQVRAEFEPAIQCVMDYIEQIDYTPLRVQEYFNFHISFNICCSTI